MAWGLFLCTRFLMGTYSRTGLEPIPERVWGLFLRSPTLTPNLFPRPEMGPEPIPEPIPSRTGLGPILEWVWDLFLRGTNLFPNLFFRRGREGAGVQAYSHDNALSMRGYNFIQHEASAF